MSRNNPRVVSSFQQHLLCVLPHCEAQFQWTCQFRTYIGFSVRCSFSTTNMSIQYFRHCL
jgi:hypothetical protein